MLAHASVSYNSSIKSFDYVMTFTHAPKREKTIQREVMAETTNLSVLMFPYLAYGHFTPFLELAKKLSDRGFLIDFCSTPINLSYIKKKIPHKYSCSIQLVELHLQDLPELPPHYHTTKDLPFHLQTTLYKALMMEEAQFHQILCEYTDLHTCIIFLFQCFFSSTAESWSDSKVVSVG